MARHLRTALPLLSLLGLVACTGTSDTLTPDNSKTDVSKIVYAVRQNTLTDADGNATSIDVAGGMGQVMDYGRYVPGGKLEIYDLRTADTQNLIGDLDQADISSVDVSFDGTRVLFTMKTSDSDHYHVYWTAVTPDDSGVYERHQLTFGDYDDINAVWADSSRIVFVTNEAYTPMGTRADEYEHSRVVTTPTKTPGVFVSVTCTSELPGLSCWPPSATICVQSGFIAKSFTSLTFSRCSQREKPTRPSDMLKRLTMCERFCEHSLRSASPPSTVTVPSCVTTRECSYSSARVPMGVYISFVTKTMRL